MGGRGFESRQKRPKLKDGNFSILGDASFPHKKSIPDQKGARSSASISRVCPGRVGADPGTHHERDAPAPKIQIFSFLNEDGRLGGIQKMLKIPL